MSNHLSPRWSRVGGRATNIGASVYGRILSAFYAGVKAGERSDVVLTSGLEAYGDAPFQGKRPHAPLPFLEHLLCLNGKLERTSAPADRRTST